MAAGNDAPVSGPPLPHAVVIGGGFAGLAAAKGLGRLPVRVTLVDRANHHLFQPLLYQVATAALNPADIARPIRSILRRYPRVEVLLGEVARIEPEGHRVALTDGAALEYDWLILAPGSRHSYFTHPEWETLAPGLKTVEDALEVRRRMLLAFERAERAATAEERQRHLTFVVVGGGPTGVEVAGAIAEIRRHALTRDFRRIDPRDASVILLEGGPRLLSSYPPALSERARQALSGLGVEVRTGTMVTAIEPDAVLSSAGRIATDTVVWAAGNASSPLLAMLRAEVDRTGRVVVEPDCTVPGRREVFVLGDAAGFRHDPRYEWLPGTAPVAMQQGRYVADLIRKRLRGQHSAPFRYRDKGSLAVIGRNAAVAQLGRLRFSGFLAWLVWVFVHIGYLIGFDSKLLVMFRWAWDYFTHKRGARLITEGPNPY